MKYHVGCSGFSYKEWKGIFYPEGLPARAWLEFYAGRFNTLEINSSFYRLPAAKSIQNWYDQTPSHFRFSIKASKFITHIKRFDVDENIVAEFCDLMHNGLKEKLGCILFQLPPSFHFSEERLQLIIEKLKVKYPFKYIVEFRHKSWWSEVVYDIFKKNDIVFCGQSYPGDIPEDVIQNNSLVYYRFHGKPVLYKSLYDQDALQAVSDAIKDKSREAYIFFNNTWGEAALKNAVSMTELLKGSK